MEERYPVNPSERFAATTPLASDLAAWRLRSGRPADTASIFPPDDGGTWTREDSSNWRNRRWAPALKAAGLPSARPYDLRHSFASLLIAEGHNPLYVASQLGHSATVLLSTYAHLVADFEGRTTLDAEAEIRVARGQSQTQSGPTVAPAP